MIGQEFITEYLNNFTIKKIEWNYEDGCILMGCVHLYQVTKNRKYRDFVLTYLDHFISEDGEIKGYNLETYNIDSINTGKILFYAYDWTKEEKYKKGIEQLLKQLNTHPRTDTGSFWHKNIYPNQVWLDGLYMAQPFLMMGETRFGKNGYTTDIINQFQNVRNHMYNEEKKLYYHGYDESKTVFWADREKGTSPNFWLRSIGWYLMALIDVIEEIEKSKENEISILSGLFKEAVGGVLLYQDVESKLFYQIPDQPDIVGNYLETSGSSMVAYSIIKGVSLGILPNETYKKIGNDMIIAITNKMIIKEKNVLKLSGICSVAGLGPQSDKRRDGSVAYYLSEPIAMDDPKGVGAYMMAYANWLHMKHIG